MRDKLLWSYRSVKMTGHETAIVVIMKQERGVTNLGYFVFIFVPNYVKVFENISTKIVFQSLSDWLRKNLRSGSCTMKSLVSKCMIYCTFLFVINWISKLYTFAVPDIHCIRTLYSSIYVHMFMYIYCIWSV